MPVELRCPDCRAKFRLPSAPEPGEDVECPECESVFSAPESLAKKSGDAPPKKRPAEEGKPPADKKKDKAASASPPQPKKRRAKKKKANRTLLFIIVGVGVLFVALVVTLLVWFFNRKSAAQEMMTYLSEDCAVAAGLNIGHLQKYPEFFKKLEPSYQDTAFRKAADALAQATGTQTNDLIDYAVQGVGPSGGTVVLKTKMDFDPAGLAKLPGAQASSVNGHTLYTIAPIPGVWAGGLRVFAPTKRLVVFFSGSIPDGTWRKMLIGNRDTPDKTLNGRFDQMCKRVLKGTYWGVMTLDDSNRPTVATDNKNAASGSGGDLQKMKADVATKLRGVGLKVSVGSKSVRFEAVLSFRDADGANALYEKFKGSDLAKGDEVEPPRFWKEFSNGLGDKKIQAGLIANIGGKASGELFILSSACDTKLVMDAGGSLIGKIVGTQQ